MSNAFLFFSCHCALLSFSPSLRRSETTEAISSLIRRGKQTPFGLSPFDKRKAKGETASSLHFVPFLAVTFFFFCHSERIEESRFYVSGWSIEEGNPIRRGKKTPFETTPKRQRPKTQ